jgi:hypothetical protein
MCFRLVTVAVGEIRVMAAVDGGTGEAAARIASDDDELALRISAFALDITTTFKFPDRQIQSGK